uniref:Uncharacterized protein n=1 Tax=Acrobeloides nanus TaxID=290746 RepID=A0A914CWW9_9BILA
MERLDKQVKSTLKQAFIELLAPKALQEDIRKFYNRELKLEECAEVRKKAIEELISKIDQLTSDIYEQYDLRPIFAEIEEAVKKQYNDKSNGWRPSDDPKMDSFAVRRCFLTQAISELSNYKSNLETQYQESVSKYTSIKDDITKELNEM